MTAATFSPPEIAVVQDKHEKSEAALRSEHAASLDRLHSKHTNEIIALRGERATAEAAHRDERRRLHEAHTAAAPDTSAALLASLHQLVPAAGAGRASRTGGDAVAALSEDWGTRDEDGGEAAAPSSRQHVRDQAARAVGELAESLRPIPEEDAAAARGYSGDFAADDLSAPMDVDSAAGGAPTPQPAAADGNASRKRQKSDGAGKPLRPAADKAAVAGKPTKKKGKKQPAAEVGAAAEAAGPSERAGRKKDAAKDGAAPAAAPAAKAGRKKRAVEDTSSPAEPPAAKSGRKGKSAATAAPAATNGRAKRACRDHAKAVVDNLEDLSDFGDDTPTGSPARAAAKPAAARRAALVDSSPEPPATRTPLPDTGGDEGMAETPGSAAVATAAPPPEPEVSSPGQETAAKLTPADVPAWESAEEQSLADLAAPSPAYKPPRAAPRAAPSGQSAMPRRDVEAAPIVRNPSAAITQRVLAAAQSTRSTSTISWGARLAARASETCAAALPVLAVKPRRLNQPGDCRRTPAHSCMKPSAALSVLRSHTTQTPAPRP